jgi:thiamine pyrophosphate-dependent acetolactate synthase large subunit-like protein
VEFHTITRHEELEFIVDRSIKQAVATQAAVAIVLSPLLTGGQSVRSLKSLRCPVSNALSAIASYDNAKVLNRFELTKRLVARLKNEEAVIGGIGNTNFDWWSAGHRPQNFYMLGSVGLAIPIAFGVALAQPQRHVIALEGDGSLLMQLGCLVTIAARQPKNLSMVIIDNGLYQITGGQPTPAAGTADYVALARAERLTRWAWTGDEEDFDRLIDATLTDDGGPAFIAVRIDDKPGIGTTDRDPVQIRQRFMMVLGVRKRLSR